MNALKVHEEAPGLRELYWGEPDEKTCISPRGFWHSDEYARNGERCSNDGTMLTERGWICGIHARVWARRGWLNPQAVRRRLEIVARNKAKASAIRAHCLREAKCI